MTSLRFPHRSVTHSLLATASITLVAWAVNHFFLLGDIKVAIGSASARSAIALPNAPSYKSKSKG